ncbi:MAG TPA: fibro-slime domain-containing protein, partial [Pirellulales bacterium]|nr:fibro-slime domain-containing protein [Pirellulales bacterium]
MVLAAARQVRGQIEHHRGRRRDPAFLLSRDGQDRLRPLKISWGILNLMNSDLMKCERAGMSWMALAMVSLWGCSAGVKSGVGGPDGSVTGAAGSGGLAGSRGGTAGAPAAPAVGFTATESGGYKLGDPVTSDMSTGAGGGGGQQTCNTILAIVRDFKGLKETNGHPDFEAFEGRGPTLGLVAKDLGADHKPVYASKCEAGTTDKVACPSGQMTTSKAMFDEWYRNVDGVNKAFRLELMFGPAVNGVATFNSTHYFPLGDAGWGYSGKDDTGKDQNFGFTTEIHTTFKYNGGEIFQFTGDDDVWIFINGKLAVDLGGLHMSQVGMVDLDAQAATLGIQQGMTYPLDLFNAERHST